MSTITINASKTYEVMVENGFFDNTGDIIRDRLGGRTAAIVSDKNVADLYGKKLKTSLKKAGYNVITFTFSAGELSKDSDTYLSLINFLANENFTRSDIVIALGGGIPGDIAGFAAATYMRGTKLVQIPTTLLAAVDSSVGGKTAVNFGMSKNLLGAFYQPDLVLCDVSLLSTLPEDIYREGCAEVIKYGIIADKELFESLEKPINEQYESIILQCIKIKSEIIAKDEYELGIRKVLNFGHTIGHAIEARSGFEMSHGNAVAMGMRIETRAAVYLDICKRECFESVRHMIEKYNLPTSVPYTGNELAAICMSDKKREDDSIFMYYPEEIGKCILAKIAVNDLKTMINQGLLD